MIHFPNKTLQRYTYTDEGTGVYGETINNYVYADNIVVDFQNESNQEVANIYGVELNNLYKIYTRLDTPLNDTDKLIDSTGNNYHIIGNIRIYDHFLSFKKANLILERSE